MPFPLRYAAWMRNLLAVAALVLAFALGAELVWHFSHRPAAMPDAPALLLKIREVARLETLDVSLYKKIDFTPDPREQSTVWASLAQWASYTLRPPRGRPLAFAVSHLGVDLRKLDESYDPSNKGDALHRVQQAEAAGEVLTGLLYVEPLPKDLHANLNTIDAPLNT